MPRKTITYDILLSCPNDVCEELEILKKVSEGFNRTSGASMGINLQIKHWSTDSFAQTGDEPQKLLNKQFIEDCDLVIGVIWTKLGTPTEEYDSGTVQEIMEAYDSGKQIFIYFSDVPISASKINPEQISKVNNFRKKIEDEKIGMYKSYSSIEDFSKIVTQDLLLYFIGLEKSMISGSESRTTELKVKALDNQGRISDSITLQEEIISVNKLEKKFKEEFLNRVNEISKLDVSEKNDEPKNTDITSYYSEKLFMEKDYEFPNKYLEAINKCGNQLCVTLPNDFFFLGNLKYKNKLIATMSGSNAVEYVGTSEEKNKLKKLNKLAIRVNEFFDTIKYFDQFSNFNSVRLILSNTGNVFCTKVTVKLIIRKNDLFFISDMDSPGEYIIEEFNNEKIYEDFFGSNKTSEVEKYPQERGLVSSSFNAPIQFPFSYNGPSYETLVEEYNDNIDYLEDFEKYTQGDDCILVYDFSEIKQHTNICFPSVLLLKKNKSFEIKYSITAKELPNVIEGKVLFDPSN